MSAKKLFCTACREEIALKRSIISSHVRSSKHIQGKERLKHKETRERDLASQLVVYDAEAHSRGETLSDTHRVYRVKVAMMFLRAGVPLNKLECFRPLLEENAHSIGGRRTISDLIPFRWSAAACQIVLVQPSSAAAERVFSILNQSFGDQTATRP